MDYAELGRQFGLNEAQTRAAFEQLAPVVAAGIRRNNQTDNGLEGLLKALQGGNHGRYADDPRSLEYDQVADDGNAILGHVFGSKDVSRGVANQAADLSGVGSAVLKKMLPVIAAIIMGQLAKKMGGGGAARAPQGGSAGGPGGGGLGDILGDILGGGKQTAPQSGPAGAPTPGGGSGGGGLGDILGDILGGGKQTAPQGGAPTPGGGSGGGGLGDILGDILGGGRQGQGGPAPRGGGQGGLEDILGDILGGGRGSGGQAGGGATNAPRPQPGSVSLEDLLREMMGGGQGGGVNRDVADRSRQRIDDVLGGGTRSGNAADDLLNSVERMTRRR
ncbi:DUF937 domain-containing protein [Taklimakanibacter deserti]|uniref:DUF937 domain-containing protein n=1 Tax=Taklimakanibacter deserti TaxID=2267839 RepID=UPI000E654E66